MSSTDAWMLVLFVLGNVAAGFAAARISRSRSAWWVLVIAIPALPVYAFFTFRVLDEWLYGALVPLVGILAAEAGRWAESRSASQQSTQPGPTSAS